jgi:ADP-ribosylglycohydrolase
MRVGPVGWAFEDLDQVLAEAARSASATHDHPEGIRGAQATAAAVFLARRRPADKQDLANQITARFGYDLSTPLDDVRPTYVFDVSCAGTVPWALRSFLEADDYETTIRNAISLGGDADTLACIAGGVAEAYYGLPRAIAETVLARLDDPLRDVVMRFTARFGGRTCE